MWTSTRLPIDDVSIMSNHSVNTFRLGIKWKLVCQVISKNGKNYNLECDSVLLFWKENGKRNSWKDFSYIGRFIFFLWSHSFGVMSSSVEEHPLKRRSKNCSHTRSYWQSQDMVLADRPMKVRELKIPQLREFILLTPDPKKGCLTLKRLSVCSNVAHKRNELISMRFFFIVWKLV